MENEQSSQPTPKTGLTNQQVNERLEKGLVNQTGAPIMKSTGEIIRDNVCTLFNFINLAIAICLALVGAWSNMFFIFIIIVNVTIGIYQELKAKKLVEELSLLSAPKAKVIRDDQESQIPVEDVVLDDLLLLEAGNQIPTDSIVREGTIEVNESLLTGESDATLKSVGDALLSGSFVVSGKCFAQVEHVGAENFAAQITQEAKKHKEAPSELRSSMRKVTKLTTFLIIPLGIALFLEAYFLRNDLIKDAVVSTSAGLLGMLPKGLMLLMSIALATGIIKLSKKKILIQELYALETLAHVDTLCLDKTGTITEGKMSIQSVFTMETSACPLPFAEIMEAYLNASTDNNATFLALDAYFGNSNTLPVHSQVAFSSQRKWSSVTFENLGSLVVGAPDRLVSQELPPAIQDAIDDGIRVLIAMFTPQTVSEEGALPSLTPMAFILLSDPIRENATETLAYFAEEGVNLKMISGDNPATVSAIAKKAGLKGAEKYIDMSTVTTDAQIDEIATAYTVFGRVSPEQKKKLVQALQKAGRTVAMTGDGVNDVLALKEADCSIAMAEGSDAARQVSQVVLLNSDFASLPDVLAEGRRTVNNVSRLAGVFFIKTVYSILLSVICLIANVPFPFIPVQITLIDLAIEGYPSFFLSFEPDPRKIQGTFLNNSFRKAIPNALTTIISILLAYVFAGMLNLTEGDTTTVMYYLVAFVTMLGVYKACVPPNKLRLFLCITMTAGFYVATLLFHTILEITILPAKGWILFLILAAVSIILVIVLQKLVNQFMPSESK